MKNIVTNFNKLITKFKKNIFYLNKEINSWLKKNNDDKNIIFITGCQRSGTTLMTEIFDRNLNIKVFGEFSELSNMDKYKIRLNPHNQVKIVIDKKNYPFIVLKPIVENQNISELLEFFKPSKALWMYRNFKDVALSNIKKFGIRNGINDLTPIKNNVSNNWRNEKTTEKTRQLVDKYFSEEMDPYDAAALFWYTRNILFFDQNLENSEKVRLFKYEDIVLNTKASMKKIYQFLGVNYYKDREFSIVHSMSVDKGKKISLSPHIEKICSDLNKNLDRIYTKY